MSQFITLFTIILAAIVRLDGKIVTIDSNPPHCTHVTKSTDYAAKFKFDYPSVYIPPGQAEAYQKLYCIHPPAISNAITVVCDWAAPPLVQFTLGDEYMHVVRQDPTGRYSGNVVITTHQVCSHNRMINASTPVEVTNLDNE